MLPDRHFLDRHAGAGHVYAIPDGFIYTASKAFAGWTKRHPWVILLSLSGAPFTLHFGGSSFSTTAAVIPPRVVRSFKLHQDGIASLNVEPSHWAYHVFSSRGAVARPIPASAFHHLAAGIRRCYEGCATRDEACATFEGALEATLAILGKAPPRRDARVERLIRRITAQSALDFQFFEAQRIMNVSPSRLSHIFTEQVGLSIRSFLLWRKIKEAMCLLATHRQITEVAHLVGFADSAHLARTFQDSIGVLPSLMGRSRCIQVHNLEAA